jgi:FkbM family methyltransferase
MSTLLGRAADRLRSLRGPRRAAAQVPDPGVGDVPPAPHAADFPAVATRADLFYCFRLLLGRLPAEDEWPQHLRWVGAPLADVVTLYLQSMEFRQRDLLAPTIPELRIAELPEFRMYVVPTDLAVGQPLLATGAYEPAVTRAIVSRLRAGMTFVDVGANVGYFTLLAASLVGPSGRVFAFEPSEANVKLLHLSRVMNGYDNVALFPIAAGADWSLSFYDRSHSNGWVSPVATTAEAVLPRTIVLAAPIGAIVPADRRIDMIKIDIEGAEFAALNGARGRLERDHPAIVTEFSPPALEAISGVGGREYLTFLTGLGYRLSVLREDGVVACGADAGRAMDVFTASGSDHIDVLAE